MCVYTVMLPLLLGDKLSPDEALMFLLLPYAGHAAQKVRGHSGVAKGESKV